VVELEGGFAEWREHGLPLEQGIAQGIAASHAPVKRAAGPSGKHVRELMSPHPIRLPSWA